MQERGIKFCRSCGENLGDIVLSLGNQPASNRLLNNMTELSDNYYPLEFKICSRCSLGQIGEYVKPHNLFEDYTYLSSMSKSWLDHSRDFVKNSIRNLDIKENDLIVEVASNDGYLLQYFKEENYKVLGIEPAENIAKIAIDKGIPTKIEFFGEELAKQLILNGQIPKLVICNNVLAHVPDINDFVKGLKILIYAGAIISIEAPSMKNMLELNLFDTIYHEHFSYLSAKSVKFLADANDISLFKIEYLQTHGGSYRYWLGDKNFIPDSSVSFYVDQENSFGIDSFKVHSEFAQNSQEAIELFKNWVLDQKEKPSGFGAAAKATVLLNAAGINKHNFEMIADNAPSKQGKWIPGANVPISSPLEVFKDFSGNLIIFPWNIHEEIVFEIRENHKNFKGQIWIALPKLIRVD
jgi:hypothetical protein